ncbi:hypothetical protein GGS26DRAFT_588606 [Hypomontagnella submonticulosa]|nr:hypothetical protein GGS26DRAFT_588606 [Hypomontagnella submonticulosa]
MSIIIPPTLCLEHRAGRHWGRSHSSPSRLWVPPLSRRPIGDLCDANIWHRRRHFYICSELIINAKPLVAYNAILYFKSYPSWNSFIPYVGLTDNVTSTPEDIYEGMAMNFISNGLIGELNTTSTESRAEHPNIFADLGNGSTQYLSYETYYAGLSTGTIALLKYKLQQQWNVQAEDLKAYVESVQ